MKSPIKVIAVLMITSALGCQSPTESFIKKFDKLMVTVEEHQHDYNEVQWSKMDNRFTALTDEYKNLRKEFNQRDKDYIDKQIGKYLALRAKGEANGLFEDLNSGLKQIEGFIDEITKE